MPSIPGEERIYRTVKSIVVPFDLPSEFSSAPLTEVIEAGTHEFLTTAVRAEIAGFIAERRHFPDGPGRQRPVRHGCPPEREAMTGIG